MTLPSIFVSHGAPRLVIEPTPTHAFLQELGTQIERPQAVICVTAHWDTERTSVSLAARPPMIYDFSGFDEALLHFEYPAPGDPALGKRILDLLHVAGLEAEGDESRGFDHGVWSPLALMFPDAAIPVVSMSVASSLPATHHFAIGQALKGLREEGVLIVGSGSTTHNLRELGRKTDSALTFEEWVCDAVAKGRFYDLFEWKQRAPYATRNHPTPEHFLPLFVPLGAAPVGTRGRVLNRHFEYGSLSMSAFTWG